jgi:neutral ceramidase
MHTVHATVDPDTTDLSQPRWLPLVGWVWMKYVLLVAGISLVGLPPRTGWSAGWKAGLAKADITPEKSVWLAGYGSRRPPDGILHPLWMKALALEDAKGHRAVLITSDFQGVPKSMSDPVFARVQQQYQLERAQILFTFSHNHCGPRLGDDLIDYYPVEAEQEQLVAEYTALMIDRTVELVGAALADLQPATLSQGLGQAGFAVNRRNNREADVPELLAKGEMLVGPVDHSVPVLAVRRGQDRLDALLFGYACHPTTLSFNTWCGDYPGFAQVDLEQTYPGVMAMFVNTCGGDQNPIPRRSVELCQKYGLELAAGVKAAMQQSLQPISPQLKTSFRMIELAYERQVTRTELEAAQKSTNEIEARWATRLLKQLDQGAVFTPSYPYPLHAWQLGTEMLVIGMGAETVVDYALRFKDEYGDGTWVMGYSDDMLAYIPSRRVWNEGGYEGGARLYEYGRHGYRWAGDIEDRISKAIADLVGEVRSAP